MVPKVFNFRFKKFVELQNFSNIASFSFIELRLSNQVDVILNEDSEILVRSFFEYTIYPYYKYFFFFFFFFGVCPAYEIIAIRSFLLLCVAPEEYQVKPSHSSPDSANGPEVVFILYFHRRLWHRIAKHGFEIVAGGAHRKCACSQCSSLPADMLTKSREDQRPPFKKKKL